MAWLVLPPFSHSCADTKAWPFIARLANVFFRNFGMFPEDQPPWRGILSGSRERFSAHHCRVIPEESRDVKVTTKDGTKIFYKDWGSGQPIVFSHGWPLSGDAWDSQMLFLGQRGYRVIAHDRRGHGRSDQPWDGYTMEQFGDDLADLINMLDLRDVVGVLPTPWAAERCRGTSAGTAHRVWPKIVLVECGPASDVENGSLPDGRCRHSTAFAKAWQRTARSFSKM